MNPFDKPCFCLILNHNSTPNNCLYLDYFVPVRAVSLQSSRVARHRHKQREVAPTTMFFHKTNTVLFINR